MYRSLSLVFFQQRVLLPSPSLMEWQGVMPLHWYRFLSLSQGLPLPDCFFTGHVSWMKYWTAPSILAHWVYSPDMAQESAHREYGEYLERNRAMFILIGGMLVVTALIFIIFVEEGGLITGVFLLAFTVVLFIISRITPGLELNRALKTPHEAYIARNGIIYEGSSVPVPILYDGHVRCFLATRNGKEKRFTHLFIYPAGRALYYPGL